MSSTTPVAPVAVVIDANGHFGDRTTVWFSGSAKAAIAFAKRNRNVQVLAGCERITGAVIDRGALQTMLAAGNWRVIG
jgi:hypothetical protein